MVNTLTKNISPLPADKYGNWTKRFTQQRDQANEGKSGVDAEKFRALRALHGFQSKKSLAAEKWPDSHFLINEEKEKWIEDYVEKETARGTKRVEDAEAAITHEPDHTEAAENGGLTTRVPEKTCHEIMVAFGDSMSHIGSSNEAEDGEDEDDEEAKQGQLSEDDKPGWVMGTITKMIQQRMEQFRQKKIKLDKLTQPGWGDTANYFFKTDNKYGTSELRVPAVIKTQTDKAAGSPVLTIFRELVKYLDIIPEISQMPQGTSQPGSRHMRLGSGMP